MWHTVAKSELDSACAYVHSVTTQGTEFVETVGFCNITLVYYFPNIIFKL